jgi:hypothetical protein
MYQLQMNPLTIDETSDDLKLHFERLHMTAGEESESEEIFM